MAVPSALDSIVPMSHRSAGSDSSRRSGRDNITPSEMYQKFLGSPSKQVAHRRMRISYVPASTSTKGRRAASEGGGEEGPTDVKLKDKIVRPSYNDEGEKVDQGKYFNNGRWQQLRSAPEEPLQVHVGSRVVDPPPASRKRRGLRTATKVVAAVSAFSPALPMRVAQAQKDAAFTVEASPTAERLQQLAERTKASGALEAFNSERADPWSQNSVPQLSATRLPSRPSSAQLSASRRPPSAKLGRTAPPMAHGATQCNRSMSAGVVMQVSGDTARLQDRPSFGRPLSASLLSRSSREGVIMRTRLGVEHFDRSQVSYSDGAQLGYSGSRADSRYVDERSASGSEPSQPFLPPDVQQQLKE